MAPIVLATDHDLSCVGRQKADGLDVDGRFYDSASNLSMAPNIVRKRLSTQVVNLPMLCNTTHHG